MTMSGKLDVLRWDPLRATMGRAGCTDCVWHITYSVLLVPTVFSMRSTHHFSACLALCQHHALLAHWDSAYHDIYGTLDSILSFKSFLPVPSHSSNTTDTCVSTMARGEHDHPDPTLIIEGSQRPQPSKRIQGYNYPITPLEELCAQDKGKLTLKMPIFL